MCYWWNTTKKHDAWWSETCSWCCSGRVDSTAIRLIQYIHWQTLVYNIIAHDTAAQLRKSCTRWWICPNGSWRIVMDTCFWISSHITWIMQTVTVKHFRPRSRRNMQVNSLTTSLCCTMAIPVWPTV
jgi:hypothetical protein